MGDPKTLEDFSKHDLQIFYKNNQYTINKLRLKIQFLTGCSQFGSSDGTDGSCIECYYDHLDLWTRCQAFGHAFDEYQKELKND